MGSRKLTSRLAVGQWQKAFRQLSVGKNAGESWKRGRVRGGWWEEEEDDERTSSWKAAHTRISRIGLDGATMRPQAMIGQQRHDVPNPAA